jgi:nitrate reductase alpha subunit
MMAALTVSVDDWPGAPRGASFAWVRSESRLESERPLVRVSSSFWRNCSASSQRRVEALLRIRSLLNRPSNHFGKLHRR